MQLKGRKIQCFITGAASGIGRSTAISMAKLGAHLFLTDINPGALEAAAREIIAAGGSVPKYKALDISQHDEVKKFADEIHAEFGAMDIVMNIAGIAIWGSVERLNHRHWEKVIQVNLLGPIYVMECFMPPMIEAGKGGHLVNVSSAAGIVALPLHAPYSASKFGLRGVSEVLRYDLMHHDIGVSVICPGAVETPLKETVQIIGVDQEHEEVKKMKQRFSNHAMSPDAVASMIVKAVQKNRYLVITSMDIRLLYWFKRKLFFVYHLIAKKMNRMMYRITRIAGT